MIDKLENKEKGGKYSDKAIINPTAVPDPKSTGGEGNYSWMYLLTPYYNQMVNDYNKEMVENTVLRQHVEYFIEMEKERELLQENFSLLKQSEEALLNEIDENEKSYLVAEEKTGALERNLEVKQPERIKEAEEKAEKLNELLSSKDGAIEQLLNEIAMVKNEKDDKQNEVLFKRQKIDNFNIEFNTKELEY